MPATHASLGTAVNPPAAHGVWLPYDVLNDHMRALAARNRRPPAERPTQFKDLIARLTPGAKQTVSPGPTRVDRANLVGGDAQQIPLPRTIVINGARAMCQSYHRGLTAPACVLDGFSCSV